MSNLSKPSKLSPLEQWQDFCQNLAQSGEAVLTRDSSAREVAEGMRYLSRLMRIGLEMHFELANPDFPGFYQASHQTAKIGADNPDNYYQNASISGKRNYRLYGHRASVPILSFATKANRYAIDGTMASTGELDVRDMVVEADGSFEIIVSKDKPEKAKNWLSLEADSSMLLVRQTFIKRAQEEAATVNIEPLEGPAYPPQLTLEDVTSGLKKTTDFISGTTQLFMDWADRFKTNNFNTLDTTDQTPFMKAGGDPSIYYLHGWWELEENEMLQIDTALTKCEGWNFQLNNVWMESLDYRYHQIHINNGSAALNPDGTVTLIVSDKDPGYGNWLDTCGHRRGTMLFRWTGADTHPVPKTKVLGNT